MKKIVKSIVIAILALWAVFGLCIKINPNCDFVHMLAVCDNSGEIALFKDPALMGNYSGMNVVWMIVWASMFLLIKKASEKREKRLTICAIILAILFSVFQIVGASISFYKTIDVLFAYFIITMIKFIGLAICYYSCFVVIFSKLSERKENENSIKEPRFFTANKKSIFATAGVIWICWLPYFLKEFPGITIMDSIYQIKECLGMVSLTNMHPFIHTFFIKICVTFGNAVFDSINAGVAIYTVLQMIIMAMIFSWMIWYMAKKKVNIGIRFVTMLYLAFCPTFPIMSLMMGKDTIFSGMMALFIIVLIELMTNSENLFKNKIRIIASEIILVLTILFRYNAMYMLLFSIPFILVLKKGYRVKLSLLLGGAIVLACSINMLINYVLNPIDSSKNAMYCVPLQQITRVMVDHKDTISKEDKDEICKFFVTDYFYESYLEYLVDPITMFVKDKYFTDNKTEFLKLWLRLMIKYPKSYVDAFLCTTSGYFDPEENRVGLWTGTCANDLGIEATPIYDGYFVNFAEKLIRAQNIPIIGLLFNTAFPIWMILSMFVFNLYQKRYEISIVFIPIFMYWLTILLRTA